MSHATPRVRGRDRLALLVAVMVGTNPLLSADSSSPDLARPPLIPKGLVVPSPGSPAPAAAPPAARLRLFRIQPGFLSDPVGLDAEDQPVAPEGSPERITFSFGNDNPHFDFRRRNDPGGVGYTRVNTQVLLFDTSATAFSLGLQAVAPAGLEQDGLPDNKGATVVSPAFSLFHALDDTLAVQAFVGTNVPLANRAAQPIRRDVQYGMAVQAPLFAEGADALRGLFVSLGALGQMRPERDVKVQSWEVMPGLHYRMAENWWISGGVSVPVGPTRAETGQGWQVTCSLQF